MKMCDLIKGLQILLPYYDNQDGYHCGAEHNVFSVVDTNNPLSDEDVKKMIALGWEQKPGERDCCEGFSIKNYDQNEWWVCYL